MSTEDKWLLPDGVEDVLPPEARGLEELRRRLLDLFHAWGYEYVIPPMVEFLESLLTGTGKDLDLRTLKVVDLLSGRMMGVRADITPQVARIDAHSLNREGVVRLCYAGTIVHSVPGSMLASRTPLSVGAELFGDSSNKADVEMVSLMVEAMRSIGIDKLHIDLGDVSIFRELMDALNIDEARRETLFELVQRKAVDELRREGELCELPADRLDELCALPNLCGDASVLEQGRNTFAAHPGILDTIGNLERVADALAARFDDLDIYFDLSELRGYGYHTGIVFAALVPGEGEVVAKGGRYDHVGQVFGRPGREATGFSIDVRALARGVGLNVSAGEQLEERVVLGDLAQSPTAALWEEVRNLREVGYIVVEDAEARNADYQLVAEGDKFRLAPIGE